MQPLDIGACLQRGWDTFTANAVPLIVGMLLAGIVSVCTLGLASGPMTVGYSQMCLRAARGEAVQIGDVFNGFSMFGPAFVLMLLLIVMIAVGCVVIVGPLVVAVLFFWAPWFMADGDTDAVSCLKRSMAFTMANLGPVLVFIIVNQIVMQLGNAVAVGTLLTVPVATAMAAHGFTRAFHAA
jgi:uncharacterized membrane protein